MIIFPSFSHITAFHFVVSFQCVDNGLDLLLTDVVVAH